MTFTSDMTLERRARRATSHCDIWDIIAPDLACPACDTDFSGRLERASQDRDEADLLAAADDAVSPEPADADVVAPPVAPQGLELADLPVRRPDARAQASELLSMLAH